jgi:hypothetical protein
MKILPVLFLLSSSLVLAQEPDEPHMSPLMFLAAFFTPSGYVEGYKLREYILSDEYPVVAKELSAKEQIDDIYITALEYSNGNKKSALLASTLGVLEHRTIPLRLPLNGELDLPLTFETEKDFNARVSRLPSELYLPGRDDRDKSQHFFLSAYLKSVLNMSWLVKLFGNAVETGEELFVIGGANDERDKHANRDGIRFATKDAPCDVSLPSEYLTANP